MYSPLTPLLPVLFRQRPCGPLLFWIFYLPHSKRPDKPGAQGVTKKFYAPQKFLGMPLAPCGEGAVVTMGEGKNRKHTLLHLVMVDKGCFLNYTLKHIKSFVDIGVF